MKKTKVVVIFGLMILLNGVHGYGSPDFSQQVIAGVDRFVQATRELNVAMMMVSKGQKDKDPRSAAIHALEGIGRLEEICGKISTAHGGLRALEEGMYAQYHENGDSPFSHLSGPLAAGDDGIDAWNPDDWVTSKALESLPELADTANRFFASQRLKLKIYAVYLVTHACPKTGEASGFDDCYDPEGSRICCNLKCLIRILNRIFDPPITPTGEALCYEDTEFKRELAEKINGFIDDLTLPELNRVSKDLAVCDFYWAKKVKEDVVIAAGELTEAGGWDYLNTVKDTFFEGLSSAWEKVSKVGGAVTTVASGDYSGSMSMAFSIHHGPAVSPSSFSPVGGPIEGIAILAPDDKDQAPCLLTRVTFRDGRALIPYTLQGPFTLYLYMPGYLPLIRKNLSITGEEQVVALSPIPANAPAASLTLANDWNPKNDSTMEIPPVPGCDISEEVYHVEHIGELDADNKAYHTRLRMKAAFDFEFGPDEREIEKVVTYQVEHETSGKAFDDMRISISPVHYTLEAKVKWTARLEYENEKKHLYVRVEVLDRGKQKLHWQVFGDGKKIMDYDTFQDCLIDPVLGRKGLDTRPKKDDLVQTAGNGTWFWEIKHDFPAMVTPGGGPAAHIGTSHIHSRVDITTREE